MSAWSIKGQWCRGIFYGRNTIAIMKHRSLHRIAPTLWLIALGTSLAAADQDHAREVQTLGDVSLASEQRWTEAVSRRRQRLETAPQPVVVLNTDDLFSTPAVSIPDRLRYVPGLDVYQSRHGQYDVGIHGYNGLTNTRMLALYDGRPFTLDAFGSVLWSGVLPMSDVAGIEIVKGPSSVTYGANAFGGVIALRGREPGSQHQVIGVADVGTFGTREGDATGLGPIGSLGYYKINVGGSYLEDWPGVQGFTDYTPSSRTSDTGATDLSSRRWRALGGCRLPWLPGDSRIEADYRGYDLHEWEWVHDLDNGSHVTSILQHDLGARVAGRWGELRYDHVWATRDYNNQKTVYDPTTDFRYSQAAFKDASDTLRGQFNQAVGNHFLGLGCEFMRWSSLSNLWSNTGNFADDATWSTVTTYNRAVFAEDQWSATRALTFTAGARADDHSQAGVNWSPRLAVNFAQSEDQFWRLSYSRGYRLPTDIETHILQYYFRSDDGLRAERIQEVDLGWSRRIDRAVNINVNGFYSLAQNQIWLAPLSAAEAGENWKRWVSTGPNPFQQPGPFFAFENLDNPVTVWGADLSLDWRLEEMPLTIFASGTWQRYRYRDDVIYHSDGFPSNPFNPAVGLTADLPPTIFQYDENLGREVNAPPEWKGNFGARYERGWFFGSLAGRYVHYRKVLSLANSWFTRGTVAVQRVPAYAALDFSLGLNFGDAGSYRRFVRLSVLDVLDTSHYESYQASPDLLRVDANNQYTSEVGRSLVVQAVWMF